MNGNGIWQKIAIGALLLATPALAQTPTPQLPEGPCPIPTPIPTATPTATPSAEATGAPSAAATTTPSAAPTATPTATPTAVPRPDTQYRSIAIILIDSPHPVTEGGADSMWSVEEAINHTWDFDIDNTLCKEFYPDPPYAYPYHVGNCGTRDLWLTATFGVYDFVRDSNSDTEADVFGPYETALDAHEVIAENTNCNNYNWTTEIRPMVYDTNPEIADYDHQVFVMPWQNPHYLSGGPYDIDKEVNLPHNACNFGGYGYVPGPVVWMNFPHSGTLAHELGHNLNLHHCSDRTDLMCGPGRPSGFNGASLIQLGVLHSSHVVEVSSNDSVVLLPMSVDPYDYPGLRVLKVITPRGDPYYIDFHDDTGVDEHRTDADKLAAGVNRWSSDPYDDQEFLGRVKNGETFIPVNGSFSVEVTDLSQGADSLEMTLEVTFFPTGTLAYQRPN